MKSTNKIQKAFIILAIIMANKGYSQLTVNGTMTPTQWVQNVLVGTGVTISNVTYTGLPIASGTFNGSASNIGFNSGVLLTNGDINNAPGPNNLTSASTNNNLPGDVDLDVIMSPYPSYDASVLEFDFVSVSDSVKFQYVFASEEYMVYANGSINDGFGFFLSGPGIAGPFSNNSINIALLPGTTTPVTINNVNLINNGQYYVDNGDGSGTGTAPDGATVQYNGFTIPLTAISAVQCGQTYHIKIAIADGSDHILDSGVFLKAGSFSSSAVQIIPQISYGGFNDSVLYEGCGTACVHFIRTTNLSNADTVSLTIGGTAINGTDYNTGVAGTPLPTVLIFQPGQDSISYCINAVSDGIVEGLESILLTITQTGPCAQTTTNATIYINEYSPMTMTVSNDTTFCNTGLGGTLTLNTYVTGGVEPYTYTWTNGASSVANPTVTVTVPTNFVVSVEDACMGSPDPTPGITDSIFVNVLNLPSVTVSILPVISPATSTDSTLYEGCRTACVHFVRTSNLAVADTLTITIGGTAQNGVDYYYNTPGTPMPNQLIFPIGVSTVTYCVNGAIDGLTEGLETVNLSIFQSNPCVQSTTNGTFHLNDLTPLALTSTNDTTFCNQGGSATISTNITGGLLPYTYTWSGGLPSQPSQNVSVTATTTYTVSVTDACVGTPDPTPDQTHVFTLTVATFDPLTVNSGDDKIVCPGDLVSLSAVVAGGGTPYVYTWSVISGVDTLLTNYTANTSFVATLPGIYQLLVKDICNNTQNDQIAVDVELSCTLNIPNIITPNNSGSIMNETFYIQNLDKFPSHSLVVYNRWGKKIYETSNYKNDFGGSKYSEGTYYYVLTVNAAGKVLPNVIHNDNIKVTETSDQRTFSGFFELTR